MGALFINVSGSFVMAMIAEYFAFKGALPQELRLFLMTGILGGYTTFSTFSPDIVSLYRSGQIAPAVLYVTMSVGLSLAAFAAGIVLIRALVGNVPT